MFNLDSLFLTLSARSVIGICSSLCAARYFHPRSDGKTDEDTTLTEALRLVIILPVLKEINAVGPSVKRLRELIEPHSNVHLVVVGSVTERDEHGNNPTLARAVIASDQHPRIAFAEASELSPSRANQVNHIVRNLSGELLLTWILQLDVDSHVSQAAFAELVGAINAGHHIIQQSALFLVNYDRLSLIQRAHALYQSRWTLGHEFKRFALSKYTHLCLYHVVSHGLCINASLLKEYGGMPTTGVVEDVEFGYYLCCANKTVHLIHNLEMADSPLDFKGGLQQMYRWSFGPLFYVGYFRRYISRFRNISALDRLKAFVLAIEGIMSSAAWNLSSYIIAVALLKAFALNQNAVLFLLLYFCEFAVCTAFFCRWGLIRTKDAFTVVPFMVLHLLTRSVPANIAFLWITFGIKVNTKKADH